MPELVPIRHGRMLASPMAYYRGAALPMTVDLAGTSVSGLRAQLCGDAHLANFGAFASPARRLVFDINDFDETLPGPFEWDVKRLAASFAIAGRANGFGAKARRAITATVAATYRTTMRAFAQQTRMQVWYSHLDVEDALAAHRAEIRPKRFKALQAMLAEARTRDSDQAMRKLTTVVDGHRRIISDPPTMVPVEEAVQRHPVRPDLRPAAHRVRQVPPQPAVRSPAPVGALRARSGGPQGRGRGQRRAAGVGGAARGRRE